MIKPRLSASAAAFDLVKRFEGYRRAAARLPDGRWMLGHGHTRSAREGAEVSEADAEALLIHDLMTVTAAIEAVVFTPLTQNQVDALASFAFNIGTENFRHSAVLRRINEGAMLDAAFALELWRKADFEGERIVIDALVRRRAAEKSLFLTPQHGWIAAPSAMIQPKADHDLVLGDRLGPDDDEASPSRRAAANLAARLRALVPDEPPAPPPEAAPEPPSEPAPFPTIPEPDPEPQSERPPFGRAAPPSAVASNGEAMRRAIFGIPEPRPKPEPDAYAPLALLGGAGLAVFIGAVIWAFHARPAGGSTMPVNIGVAIVGFIGILCVASAVYFLLEKLAGREP